MDAGTTGAYLNRDEVSTGKVAKNGAKTAQQGFPLGPFSHFRPFSPLSPERTKSLFSHVPISGRRPDMVSVASQRDCNPKPSKACCDEVSELQPHDQE